MGKLEFLYYSKGIIFDSNLFCAPQVMEAAQASTGLSGGFRGGSFSSVNHIAHFSGALIGVFLVWLMSRIPTEPPDQDVTTRKKNY